RSWRGTPLQSGRSSPLRYVPPAAEPGWWPRWRIPRRGVDHAARARCSSSPPPTEPRRSRERPRRPATPPCSSLDVLHLLSKPLHFFLDGHYAVRDPRVVGL